MRESAEIDRDKTSGCINNVETGREEWDPNDETYRFRVCVVRNATRQIAFGNAIFGGQ